MRCYFCIEINENVKHKIFVLILNNLELICTKLFAMSVICKQARRK